MGEKAKKLGEEFENTLIPIFDILGYSVIKPTFNVPCKDATHRNEEGKPRKFHGIDFLLGSRSKIKSEKRIIYASPKKGSPKSLKKIIDEHYEATRCLNKYIEDKNISQLNSKIDMVWIVSENLPKDLISRKPEESFKLYLTTKEDLKWLYIISTRLKELEKKGTFYFYQPSYISGSRDAFSEFFYPEWLSHRFYVHFSKRGDDSNYVIVFDIGEVNSIEIEQILNNIAPLSPKELIIHCRSGFSNSEKVCISRINKELKNNMRPWLKVNKVILISEKYANPLQYPEESKIWSFDPL